MTMLIADSSGKSSAKSGDYVVTGGGLYKKTDNGSIRVSGLSDLIGKDVTSSYADVQAAYTNAVAKYGGGGSSGSGGSYGDGEKIKPELVTTGETVNTTETPNGLQTTIAGYDPNLYAQGYNSTSSAGASKIVGGVILALLGIAILDMFVGGKGK